MALGFDEFASRMTVPLSGVAQLLTGDREAAAALVHTALTTVRVPDERRATATLVRVWLAGAPPVGEPVELPYDQELLRRALDALPDKQRIAVVLHHWSGLPVPDIAAMLRRPSPAVAADLAAGVAELPEPDEPVATRLAALVAAAGPPLVDVDEVVEAGQAQRRQRRRTAVVAAAVLLAAAMVAPLLTSGDSKQAITTDRTWSLSDLPPAPVIDDRARRLTAQLAAALPDVLPGVTDLRPGTSRRPPLEFATGSEFGANTTYFAEARFGTTLLILFVHSQDPGPYAPCSVPGDLECTSRQFPDGTVAEVDATIDVGLTAVALLSQRPDGTILSVLADNVGGSDPPDLSTEDLFRFATVFTY